MKTITLLPIAIAYPISAFAQHAPDSIKNLFFGVIALFFLVSFLCLVGAVNVFISIPSASSTHRFAPLIVAFVIVTMLFAAISPTLSAIGGFLVSAVLYSPIAAVLLLISRAHCRHNEKE